MIDTVRSIRDVEEGEWDDLVGEEGSPFLEWRFLASLEEAGCVEAETGWLPAHLVLRDRGRLVGGAPAYVKSHSFGEFVFDQGWAEGAEAAGIRYYPKLLVGVPFTPVAGPRLLVHPDADADRVRRALGKGLIDLCRRLDLSSIHVNFCVKSECEALADFGFGLRTGYQFHWRNRGFETFDDYLTSLRSKRRNQIRRERRAIGSENVRVDVVEGNDIPDAFGPRLHRLYRSTVDRFFWGRPYLNARFFEVLVERWRSRLSLVLAFRDEALVAGAINVRKGDALYGRYWGAFVDIAYLHFEVCYYAGIEHCIREGLSRFEPGAGGEFKRLRGFDPVPTASMHWIADPRLERAIQDFLERERDAVDRRVAILNDHTARRREGS